MTFMPKLLAIAKVGAELGEVPIAAAIIGPDGIAVATYHNEVELRRDATAHAELLAIQMACRKLGRKYLEEYTLMVTLEPCAMCAQAASLAKIGKIIYGAYDAKGGAIEHGARVAWFVPDDPEATMKRLIAQGDVNVEKPEESLLLLKPLNKVPHGGGVKMLHGDAGYKLFRAWLEDYAKSVKGGYRTVKELPVRPAEALVHIDTILNVTGGPMAWADKLLRVDVYPWEEARNDWALKPIATHPFSFHQEKP